MCLILGSVCSRVILFALLNDHQFSSILFKKLRNVINKICEKKLRRKLVVKYTLNVYIRGIDPFLLQPKIPRVFGGGGIFNDLGKKFEGFILLGEN